MRKFVEWYRGYQIWLLATGTFSAYTADSRDTSYASSRLKTLRARLDTVEEKVVETAQ